MSRVATGLDRLVTETRWQQLARGNLGYLCHGASVAGDLRHGVELLRELFPGRLKKLFTPQHGFFSDVQANMVETGHSVHPQWGLPVFSLYSRTRRPTIDMLSGIDTVIVDLQDVGTRVYTYIHTLSLVMETCATHGLGVLVLDRPNPINGEDVEGNVLDPDYRSFVGLHPIPMRHAMTIGELARLYRDGFGIACALDVVPMSGWERRMFFDETGLHWVFPSPNMPTLDTAILYPGGVLYEGTSISEGRGTTRPFELIGHPGLDPYKLVSRLEERCHEAGLGGFHLRPQSFQPTFDKHAREGCGGFQVHVLDRRRFRSWRFTQVTLRCLREDFPGVLSWNAPPYEYEAVKLPIDILNGSDEPRRWVDGSAADLVGLEGFGYPGFLASRSDALLY